MGKHKYCLAAIIFMLSLGIGWKLCSASWGLVGLLYFARDCLQQATHVKGMVGTREVDWAHRQIPIVAI
jgi:hypothetical protein